MQLMFLDEIKGTEICAQDIRSNLDFVLIPKGTVLKQSYLPALKNLGITQVAVVTDEDVKANNGLLIPKEIIDSYRNQLEEIYHSYKNGQGLGKIEILAEGIVDFCKDNPKIKMNSAMERTRDVFEHSVVVTLLSIMVGIQMDFVRSKLYQMAMACLVHDFSLLSLSIDYCGKNIEDFTEEQRIEIENHPRKSYEILADQNYITQEAKEMVLSHHERINGRGYPNKTCCQDICCKIIQAIDAMDGMLCGIERKQLSYEETCDFMQSHKTCRYDRPTVEIACQLFAK